MQKYEDRVQETSTTVGTGNIALAGATQSYRAFSTVAANNDQVAYRISGVSDWETGIGIWQTGNTLVRKFVRNSSNAGALVNFSGEPLIVELTLLGSEFRQLQSPARLSDTTDLITWYTADNPKNTVNDDTGIVTVFDDKSGNGHTFTPSSGTIVKQFGQQGGLPCFNFATGQTTVAGITIPLKGAMTYFAALKVTATTHYQNLFKPSGTPAQPNDLHAYWDQPTNKWQIDGSVTGTSPVGGTWHVLVVHYYNTGSVMHFKVRQDGTQILGDTASTNGSNPVPGSAGSPSNMGLNLFLDSVANAFPYTSQLAECGFYAVSKDGTEAALEQYLRARYGTW